VGEADESSSVVADDGRQGTEDTPSADLILQSLTKRPNVRSTLILSRKDGSIIKASGAIADDTPAQAQDRRREDAVQDEHESEGVEEPKVTKAQALASSIYGFVAAATVLGDSVRSVDNESSMFSGRPGAAEDDQAGGATMEDQKAQARDDVQLLRLRLKKQEIIIFPDSRYLCCVVQDLDKSPR